MTPTLAPPPALATAVHVFLGNLKWKESLKKIAPTWMNVSLAMKKEPETDKAFGWVLEMYAYATSSALHNEVTSNAQGNVVMSGQSFGKAFAKGVGKA
nr:hydroxyproline O-arabinosyltransferase 1 [Ipomoea trifida]